MAKRSAQSALPPTTDALRRTLADNIRGLRKRQSISQEDLAFRCGLDRTYVSAVERCIWNVSLGNIEKMALALGVEPWQLLLPEQRKLEEK
ncbi:MAG: helix-turn-helix transcriptional regulator [Sideroxydans sp.]|nr:helix-turn-helix transcriptional regulator [Sideroxydans sp.]